MSNNILASQQQDAFEAYVQLQAKAAELVRTACGGRNELLSRIEELEAEVQVVRGIGEDCVLARSLPLAPISLLSTR